LAPGGQSDAEEESFHGFILWVYGQSDRQQG
jgi:hypothetical protein